jgi:hypothetical protein
MGQTSRVRLGPGEALPFPATRQGPERFLSNLRIGGHSARNGGRGGEVSFWIEAGRAARRSSVPLLVALAVAMAATTAGGADGVELPGLVQETVIGALPSTPVDAVLPLQPEIVIDPPAWDFGDADVNHGASHYIAHEFVVRNEGMTETGELCFRLISTEGSVWAFSFPGSGTGFCTTVRLAPGHVVSEQVVFAQGIWDGPSGEQRGRLEVFERTENAGSKPLAAAELSGRGFRSGYWLTTDGGTVVARNGAPHYGDASGIALSAWITALAGTPSGAGYWLATADGSVYPFGDAEHHGSAEELIADAPVIGMAAHPGGGYWLVTEEGGVFAFGAAPFLGSLGDEELMFPIVAIAASPSGDGYWLVGAEGAVYPFGDAEFHGSTEDVELESPILSMATTGSGDGYWLVSAEGAVFPFGNAQIHHGYQPGGHEICGIARTQTGAGYWLAAPDGSVFHYGDATQSTYDPSGLGSRDGEPNIVIDIDAVPLAPRERSN